MSPKGLVTLYSDLASLPAEDLEPVLACHSQSVSAPSGAMLFDQGNPCRGFPMLLTGSVRVARGSPVGRLLALYRRAPGDLCGVSLACVFGGAPLTARGQALEAHEPSLLSPEGLNH